MVIKKEKDIIKKGFSYKYYPPKDLKKYYSLTVRL